jgi:pSer/pThr/pTyr-binding forkhead associated (FHA) protein
MQAQLIPLDGSNTITINRDLTLVGRQEGCDMRIQHKSVSKMHCVLARTDGLLLVRDLGSTNGTRVNGQRVRRAALLPNDNLAVAGFKFRVHLGPDDEPALPNDRTQQLDAKDVSRLLDQAEQAGKEPELEADGPLSVQANALPDVYPVENNDPSG